MIEGLALVVACIAGIVSIIAIFVADRRADAAEAAAKKANKLAEDANRVAELALAEAAKANQIAEDANKLSEDSNAIVRKQAAQQADPSHIEWVAEWDKKTAEVTLRNTGRHVARNVTVLVQGNKVDHLSEGHDDVPRNGELVIAFPELIEHRREYLELRNRQLADAGRRGIIILPKGWARKLTIDIRWDYESGKPGVQTIELTAR